MSFPGDVPADLFYIFSHKLNKDPLKNILEVWPWTWQCWALDYFNANDDADRRAARKHNNQ